MELDSLKKAKAEEVNRAEAMDAIPDDPSRREILGIFDKTTWERCNQDTDGLRMLRYRGFYPIFPETVADHPIVQRLRRNGILLPGNLLLQSPYDDALYYRAENAIEESAVQKFYIFANFVRLLGATRFLIEQDERATTSHRVNAEISAGSRGVEVGLDSSIDYIRIGSREIAVYAEFDGGEPDLEGAHDLLMRNRLDTDIDLRQLLEMRAGSSLVRRLVVTLNLSREMGMSAGTALRVVVPSFFQGKMKLEVALKSLEEYKLHLLTIF